MQSTGLEALDPTTLVVRRRLDAGRRGAADAPSSFQVLARRWVVERTLAWLNTNRRLAKDYERLVETGEMLLYLAMSRILLRRLTRKGER
ncbi:transposase [Microvirga sp. VF16]|uniref:transposase n=1 Tax=Microvirga sp. VF16 TaxID=2807101 RepID=UPI0035300688